MAQVSRTICSDELDKEVPSMRNIGIFGVSAFGQGPWRPGKKVWAIAIVGASEVDFRQAQLDEGVTSVTCITFLGTSKIVTPSEMPATLTGLSILGVRSTKRQLAKEIPPTTAKSLKVSCFTFAGTFRITDKA
jgi:hypothetical protein